MALTFNISKEDILRGKTIEPGWYTAVVKEVREEAASTDGSKLAVIDLTIKGGNYDGVPVVRYFSEKAPGFIIPFLTACGAPVGEAGGSFDIERCKGRTISVYIKNEMYQNRMTNKAEDFKMIAGVAGA